MDFSVNSGFMYALAIIVIDVVAAQSIFFLVKASRQAKAIGISRGVVRKTITSSVIFSIAPAFSFLIGVISLSAFLGFPIPWLRMSVLGAITYELPAAEATARGVGISTASLITDPKAFSAIVWVMTLGIIPGIFVILFGLKKIQSGVISMKSKDEKWGDLFLTSMFLGMISAFVGVLFADIRQGLPGWIPVAVALCSALCMGVLGILIKVKKIVWLEQYALPISMLFGMAMSIPLTGWMA